MPLEATFFVPDREPAPRKETGSWHTLSLYETSPHPWHLFLIPKSQSRQFNLEIKAFVFVVARFTGMMKVIHFEKK